MCKLYFILKGGVYFTVFSTPEGTSRDKGKSKGNLISKYTAIAREVYKLKIHIIDLEV